MQYNSGSFQGVIQRIVVRVVHLMKEQGEEGRRCEIYSHQTNHWLPSLRNSLLSQNQGIEVQWGTSGSAPSFIYKSTSPFPYRSVLGT